MAKYLRPRRGTKSNAINNNIVLKKGEMFLCMAYIDAIGKGPGAIYIGDGASSFSQYTHNGSTVANTAQPFLVHPMIYNPIFVDTGPYGHGILPGTNYINNIGNGTGQVTLPSIIGYIKGALCAHAVSINTLISMVAQAKGSDLTQAVYNNLSTSAKNNGTPYYINDATMSAEDAAVWNKVGTADLATTATSISGAINEYYRSKVNADYYLNHLGTYRLRAGTYVTSISSYTAVNVFSNAKCNELLGVSNSGNGNTIVYFTNGDHATQGQDVIGTYHDGSNYWYARFSGYPSAGNYRFNYIIFYFG